MSFLICGYLIAGAFVAGIASALETPRTPLEWVQTAMSGLAWPVLVWAYYVTRDET